MGEGRIPFQITSYLAGSNEILISLVLNKPSLMDLLVLQGIFLRTSQGFI